MAPVLRFSRAQARRLVAAPCAVSRDDVQSAPPCGCLGAGRAPPAPPRRVPLSALDTFLFVRLLQIPVAFFYRSRVDADALATSLGRTLERFPIVAGRLRPAAHGVEAAAGEAGPAVDGDYDVLCNNEGVYFDVFECDGTIADFDGFADWSVVDRNTQPVDNVTPPRFCGKLDTAAAVAGTAPLARFRLTHLRDGGSIVAMTFSHILVDGQAGLMFSAAWSAEHEALLRGGAPKPLPLGPPVFDRRVFVAAATEAPPAADLPPSVAANTAAAHAKAAALLSGLTARAVAYRIAKAARDVALRPSASFTIRITGAQLARARAKGGAGLSANDVTVGLAWALLRRCRARGPRGAPRLGDGSEQFLLQTVDLRRYLPSLPAAYFGNSAWAMQLTASAAAEGAPLPLAAGCRASMASFADSVAIFDQAAAVLRATPAGRDGADGDAAAANRQKRGGMGGAGLKAALLPAFGDGMFSSWVAPVMWTFTFGAGTPAWFHGGIFPAAPWHAPTHGWLSTSHIAPHSSDTLRRGFCVLAARPDASAPGAGGDVLLCGTCPRSAAAAVRAEAQRVLLEMAGPEPEERAVKAAAAPVEEVASAAA